MAKGDVKAFYPVTDTISRTDAYVSADKQAIALSEETGLKHGVGWNRELKRYEVRQIDLDVPEEAWTSDRSNVPQLMRLKPGLQLVYSTLDRILIDAASLAPSQWIATRMEGVTDPARKAVEMQAAFDAQYGRGGFWVTRHGNILSVQCRRKEHSASHAFVATSGL